MRGAKHHAATDQHTPTLSHSRCRRTSNELFLFFRMAALRNSTRVPECPQVRMTSLRKHAGEVPALPRCYTQRRTHFAWMWRGACRVIGMRVFSRSDMSSVMPSNTV